MKTKYYIFPLTDKEIISSQAQQIKLLKEKVVYLLEQLHKLSIKKDSIKLIRQYIPKKTAFDTLTDKQITQIQYKINRRPREKLNFKTPKEIFYLNTAYFLLLSVEPTF